MKEKKKTKTTKKKTTKKPKLVCEVCEAVVVVEKPCECVECDIICCGEQMKEK